MDKLDTERNDRVVRALDKYADTVRRVCFMYLKNTFDVEDVFQDVFLQLFRYEMSFESDAHEKSWLIRVAINKCKDLHKSFFRSRVFPLDDIELTFEDETDNDIIREILALPQKYKDTVYLHYYEGYSVPEISGILKTKENTIYSYLHRAKKMLREKLEC